MKDSLLLGIGRFMIPIPRWIWQRQVQGGANLEFMTEDHHRVRNFVVTEIGQSGIPLSPDFLAQTLQLPLNRLIAILDDLEKHLTFLFRDEEGAVEWAYPVTAVQTPHRLIFNDGKQVNAA